MKKVNVELERLTWALYFIFKFFQDRHEVRNMHPQNNFLGHKNPSVSPSGVLIASGCFLKMGIAVVVQIPSIKWRMGMQRFSPKPLK